VDHGTARPLSIVDASAVVGDVIKSLRCMHANGYAHFDLIPGNVLLRRQNNQVSAYLSDFGVSVRIGQPATISGNFYFTAPELYVNNGVPDSDWRPCDVFQLGIIAFAAVTGKLHLRHWTRVNNIKSPVGPLAPENAEMGRMNIMAADFIGRCLYYARGGRWTLDVAAQHPFILHAGTTAVGEMQTLLADFARDHPRPNTRGGNAWYIENVDLVGSEQPPGGSGMPMNLGDLRVAPAMVQGPLQAPVPAQEPVHLYMTLNDGHQQPQAPVVQAQEPPHVYVNQNYVHGQGQVAQPPVQPVPDVHHEYVVLAHL